MTKKKAAPAKAAPKSVSAKTKVEAKSAAKGAPEKAAKPAKPGKSAKDAVKQDDEEAPTISREEAVDAEEMAEDEAAASSGGGGGGGNAAALAAASGSGEMSASFKNFRHHPDMENFYRFIYENDLRHEALDILNQMLLDKQTEKTAKKGGNSPAAKR